VLRSQYGHGGQVRRAEPGRAEATDRQRRQLQPFSNDIMAACYKATTETYDEIATKNAKFKKIYEPWKAFRAEQVSWFAVAENRFDNFMIAAERLSRKK
jgi:TRAP-type mannitol/chloroaromatic compound transport system substrate-binding protein